MSTLGGVFFVVLFQCSDLARPYESIPKGTFASILTSMGLYTVLLIIMALAAPQEVLERNENLFLLSAWPNMYMGYGGAILVGLISSLSCLEAAPRILQAIAQDRAVRALNPWDLGHVSYWNNEPNKAIAFTAVLILPFMFVEDIGLIAESAAVCFLTMYTGMNFSAFIQSVLRLHTWRPHFRMYSWGTALLGCITCSMIMFYMEGVIALVVVLMAVGLFFYIEVTGDKHVFGHGVLGLKYHIALNALLGVEERGTIKMMKKKQQHLKSSSGKSGFWRPQLLVYLHASDEPVEDDQEITKQLLSFASQLKSSSGLTIVAAVVKEQYDTSQDQAVAISGGTMAKMAEDYENRKKMKRRLMKEMARYQVVGFAEVLIAPNYRTGLSMLMQLAGLGGLRPNTCVMGWPDYSKITDDRASRTLEFIARATGENANITASLVNRSTDGSPACCGGLWVTVHGKAVVALKQLTGNGAYTFPSSCERLSGYVDIWWIVHDGGILILVAYLLHRHAVWRACRLRLFTVVKRCENIGRVKKDLSKYLQALRIPAEVHVVSLGAQHMGDYATDWTIRRRKSIEDSEDLKRPRLQSIFESTETPASFTTTLPKFSPPPPLPSEINRQSSKGLDSHLRIHRVIMEHSMQSCLVLLNLPPPPKSTVHDPVSYFHLVSCLSTVP